MHRLGIGLLIVGATILAACAAEAPDRDVVGRDSAGIRIADNVRPAWIENAGWQIESEPILEIGVQEGDPAYQLYRAFDAMRLDDGAVLVSNSGSAELRLFDAAGRFVRSAGRQGAGPGEFGQFSSMWLCLLPAGQIAVDDRANGRVNVFSPDLTFIRTVRIEPPSGIRPPRLWDCFSDGTWLTWVALESLRGAPGEVIRPAGAFHHYGGDGRPLGQVLELPGRPRYINRVGNVTNYPFVPLTADAVVVAGADRVIVGMGSAPEIERRTRAGAIEALIRWPGSDRRRSADVYERYKTHSLAHITDEALRLRYARLYAQDLPVPDSTPALQSLIVDADGHTWVERFRLPWEEPPLWEVFDRDGRWLGTVETPAGLSVLQVGSDFLLGRHLDELGVERIRVHRIRKTLRTPE